VYTKSKTDSLGERWVHVRLLAVFSPALNNLHLLTYTCGVTRVLYYDGLVPARFGQDLSLGLGLSTQPSHVSGRPSLHPRREEVLHPNGHAAEHARDNPTLASASPSSPLSPLLNMHNTL